MKTSQAESASALGTAAKSIVVGTAGHIDHGKTALVFALTGTDTDRLPEEKQRGITIDLGFASMDIPGVDGASIDVSLIDVPGHHAFIRNMLAGTGGIDCVMLVIAADEGVKAQTEEHLAICSLLGIERGIVALTKADVVSAEHLNETRVRVSDFLRNTFLSAAPILPVSAFTGEGLAELKAALAAMATAVPQRSTDFIPRLPLDRAFSIRGFGTVVTGTLQSGAVRAGDTLEQHPSGRSVRARGVQVHGHTVNAAQAPCRVALNISGVEVAEVHRGDTLAPPGLLSPVRVFDVELSLLEGASPLKHGSRVRVHAFASESPAAILFFNEKQISGSSAQIARLRLTRPMLLIPGDRFVLRQPSPAMTIGGGRVLDAHPTPGLRKPAAFEWLNALRQADRAGHIRLRIERRGKAGIYLSGLVAETGLTPEAIRNAIAPLVADGRLIECSNEGLGAGHWISAESFSAVMEEVLGAIQSAGPQPASRAELRSKTKLSQPVFELAIERLLAAGKIEVAADQVHLAGRRSEVSDSRRKQLEAVESIYATAGLAAPLVAEVAGNLKASPQEMRELITLLLRSGRLVRMEGDALFVHTGALEKLYANLRIHRGESFDVTRFKSFTGLTRKHAIPLLEHLDRARVTRNTGGVRVVL